MTAAGCCARGSARQVGRTRRIRSISPASPAGASSSFGRRWPPPSEQRGPEALEHGAASATVLVRRTAGCRCQHPIAGWNSAGFLRNFFFLRRSRRRVALALHAAHLRDEPASAAGDLEPLALTLPLLGRHRRRHRVFIISARMKPARSCWRRPVGAFRGDFVIAGTGLRKRTRARAPNWRGSPPSRSGATVLLRPRRTKPASRSPSAPTSRRISRSSTRCGRAGGRWSASGSSSLRGDAEPRRRRRGIYRLETLGRRTRRARHHRAALPRRGRTSTNASLLTVRPSPNSTSGIATGTPAAEPARAPPSSPSPRCHVHEYRRFPSGIAPKRVRDSAPQDREPLRPRRRACASTAPQDNVVPSPIHAIAHWLDFVTTRWEPDLPAAERRILLLMPLSPRPEPYPGSVSEHRAINQRLDDEGFRPIGASPVLPRRNCRRGCRRASRRTVLALGPLGDQGRGTVVHRGRDLEPMAVVPYEHIAHLRGTRALAHDRGSIRRSGPVSRTAGKTPSPPWRVDSTRRGGRPPPAGAGAIEEKRAYVAMHNALAEGIARPPSARDECRQNFHPDRIARGGLGWRPGLTHSAASCWPADERRAHGVRGRVFVAGERLTARSAPTISCPIAPAHLPACRASAECGRRELPLATRLGVPQSRLGGAWSPAASTPRPARGARTSRRPHRARPRARSRVSAPPRDGGTQNPPARRTTPPC